ncbi:hypothetical protein DdX_20126 [Ditylenchus destructor]|uniref:Uncharacterized protein n=1 Tax=Ditylenchus destructor TaxID=166010 RepID=A0AAD4MII3_9BILA|nr:hypothetical protein DdX_20126 [Ditylenchus destructor]
MKKKLREFGLIHRYDNEADFALYCRMIPALSFVRLNDVKQYAATLFETLPDCLDQVASWFEHNYIGEITNSQNMPRRGGKHRRANSKSNQNQRLLRENVNISDDTWLETLKFMTCPQWSQKCFVSRQINRVAQRDISRLPKMVLDNATMYYIQDNPPKELKKVLSNSTIIAFDTFMQEEQSTHWLESRGFSLDAPVDILPENALIGVNTSIAVRPDFISL